MVIDGPNFESWIPQYWLGYFSLEKKPQIANWELLLDFLEPR
jgi:hypothetical protein